VTFTLKKRLESLGCNLPSQYDTKVKVIKNELNGRELELALKGFTSLHQQDRMHCAILGSTNYYAIFAESMGLNAVKGLALKKKGQIKVNMEK
jgi:hypothetical protein